MASDSKVVDWRSTGRRKARRALFNARIPFKCAGIDGKDCGKTTVAPPKDAPNFFEEIWPAERRVLNTSSLQADHQDKDVTNNSVENLAWRCASCHKKIDMRSAKGVSQKADEIKNLL